MRSRFLILLLSVCAIAAGLGVSAQPSASAAAIPTIAVDVIAPQQVTLDPYSVAANVTWTASGCPFGCELYRVGHLRMNTTQELVDSRTFGEGPTQTFRVADFIVTQPRLGWDYQYELRTYSNVQRDGYDTPAFLDLAPSFGTEGAFRYGSGWRRELQLASTETMIMRSWTPGASATLPA